MKKENKYTKFFIQLILSIPFYYLSMVVVNILMVLYREIERISEKKGFKFDMKYFEDFKFNMEGLFIYNDINNYVYLGVGIFLTYFYIIKPILELRKELRKETIPYLDNEPYEETKKKLDGFMEYKEERNVKGLKSEYVKKDASEVLKEEFSRELGVADIQSIKPKASKKRIDLDSEEEEYLNRGTTKPTNKVKQEVKSEDLYKDDSDYFFTELAGVRSPLKLTSLEELEQQEELEEELEEEYSKEEENQYDDSEKIDSRSKNRLNSSHLETEITTEEDNYIMRERLNQIEREKVRKKLTSFKIEE